MVRLIVFENNRSYKVFGILIYTKKGVEERFAEFQNFFRIESDICITNKSINITKLKQE